MQLNFVADVMDKYVMLSFDVEEFDVPREQGVEISLVESVRLSEKGLHRILDLLAAHKCKATFFCTVNFATLAPDAIKRIIHDGHEIAAHGCDHWNPTENDAQQSSRMLSEILTGIDPNLKLLGFRHPRMHYVNLKAIRNAGFFYDSSLNPTWIPGYYFNLDKPRSAVVVDNLIEIPVSTSPRFRIPLFWLSLHHFPQWLYNRLALRCLKHDNMFNTYFHPWEFIDLNNPNWKIGYLHRRHSGKGMIKRLDNLISFLEKHDAQFITYSQFATHHL